MLVEAPLGNLSDPRFSNAQIDWLDLTWQQCISRAVRAQSRGGQTVRILLRLGETLRHGDVLCEATSNSPLITVNLLPCPVLIARPETVEQSIQLAYELGDLHVPVQLEPPFVITLPDGPVEAALGKLGISFESAERRFEPSLRGSTELSFSPDLISR